MDCEIIVSPLHESDIPSVMEIECDSQPEPWSERAFLEEIDRLNSSLLVARISCENALDSTSADVAGYICFWSVAGEIQILNIAVRKTLRRKGIGEKLIKIAIRAGLEQHAESITLEVRKGNVAARRLYQSLGFKVMGERPGYYSVRNESAILMGLEIAAGLVGF